MEVKEKICIYKKYNLILLFLEVPCLGWALFILLKNIIDSA
jgi:hypothetical protein